MINTKINQPNKWTNQNREGKKKQMKTFMIYETIVDFN